MTLDGYDFIIVGAGGSGCVLANRLSADPRNSVLLLEAGGEDSSPYIHMPRGFGKILSGTKGVWSMSATPGPWARRQETWQRGKVLGGSTSINGMVYARGSAADYDDWGVRGWAWKDLVPCFKAMEDHELGPGESRGAGGPLKISVQPGGDELCDALISATQQSGVPRARDLNEIGDEAVGYQPCTIWKGRRQSAAVAFLHPVRRRTNLRVLTRSEVIRVIFEGRRAAAVELADRTTIRAKREVVLAAGAINSPKLLMLSGIGPGAELMNAGVKVIADVPAVGKNMSEHRVLMFKYRVTRGSNNAKLRGLGLLGSLARYALGRSGPLASAAFEVGAFVKSRPSALRADCQLGITLASVIRQPDGAVVVDSYPGLSCCSYIMRPFSRGSIQLRSSSPADPPQIDANYLSDERDRRTSVDMVRAVRRLFSQPALQSFGITEVEPGSIVQTDEDILDAFRHKGESGYHAVGTCGFGESQGSVVDPGLRVRGVDGLRIADISVLPSLVSGNTGAIAMAIGWRAAQLILDD